jgi:hypothetical protein
MYKVEFHIVALDELSKMQQKINTWLTTGHLKKFDTHVVGDKLVFQCLVKKT